MQRFPKPESGNESSLRGLRVIRVKIAAVHELHRDELKRGTGQSRIVPRRIDGDEGNAHHAACGSKGRIVRIPLSPVHCLGLPLLVVGTAVGIFLVFSLMTFERRSPSDYLAEVRGGSAGRRWQAAFEREGDGGGDEVRRARRPSRLQGRQDSEKALCHGQQPDRGNDWKLRAAERMAQRA